ncbi:MAG: ThuA domain-containing protein, partial [Planctomycetota bacterium]|nr:ThuA domain-containing protein [Planctomycetota bacterium]
MLHNVALLLALSAPIVGAAAQDAPSVYIRAGEKTHGPGEHDHPRFLEDWTALLEERGCEVEGSLEFPSAEELARADVLVTYAADGGSIHGDERERLEAFLARGGGIVVLHDAVCGDDPHWFKSVVGGAWEHGHSKWHTGEIGLYFADREHPITRGVANFDFVDEIYHELHMAPDARVLANAFHTPFDVTPQMWVVEREYRAFVSLQGHYHDSFSHPAWRTLLLRGIAWAAGRDADSLVSAAEIVALRYPEGGPRRPEEAHETFELHPDFELELVASEPLVVNPISIDWDPDGRMWVALTPGYPGKEEFTGVPAHDLIAILEDTDGDGRMDRRKVFHEGLDLVTSLVFHRDGVIVTAAPQILWLRDTDGDDVADVETVLYTGFGYSDTHAVISNMRWGLDGWIYATQGYSGNASDITGFPVTAGDAGGSSPGGRGLGMERGRGPGMEPRAFGRIGNGVLRFKPDGTAIETVVSYGSNTWGLDFTWDGELFFTMANGSHLRHVVLPDRVLAGARIGDAPSWKDVVDHRRAFPLTKHERPPYLQIDFVGGFTAAAGGLVYSGAAWPEEFAGNHFVCEPTVNLVHRDVVEPAGSTYVARKPRQAEFLASNDLWFRPVHLRTGPDGAMYVLDFYNQAAVHNDTRGPRHGPTNAAVRPDRDHLHGRIWRVRHAAQGAYDPPRLTEAPNDQLVEELEHPNRWRRMAAHRLLLERAPISEKKTLTKLGQLALGASTAPPRVHALWLLHDQGPLTGEALSRPLRDPDPGVRRNAARIHALTPGKLEDTEFVHAVKDPDPRAWLETMISFRGARIGPFVAGHLINAWPDLDDWQRSAAFGILERDLVATLALGLLVLPAPDENRPPPTPAEYLPLVEAAATHIARSANSERIVLAAGVLGSAGEAPTVLLERALRAFHEGLAPGFEPHAPIAPLLAVLLRHEDTEIGVAVLPLLTRWETDDRVERDVLAFSERLVAMTQDPEVDIELRGEGIRASQRFLDPFFPSEVQQRVIDELGAAADQDAH